MTTPHALTESPASPPSVTDWRQRAAIATPARILVGAAGGSYPTPTQLQLRADHAAARDAVHAELRLDDFPPEFVAQHRLFEVQTQAETKAEFLLRPDRGRALSSAAQQEISASAALPPGLPAPAPATASESRRLQIVMGDGLSASAVRAQAPGLLPLLIRSAQQAGWQLGRVFLVRYCRVGVMNDVGALLQPDVVILLIGERPGLATAESLSAYMAYRPQPGDTDARRNLISNIHARGVSHEAAVVRMLDLAEQMLQRQRSGVDIKERLPVAALGIGVLEPEGDIQGRKLNQKRGTRSAD